MSAPILSISVKPHSPLGFAALVLLALVAAGCSTLETYMPATTSLAVYKIGSKHNRGPRAIGKWRETMGATDPAKAAPGTIRRDLGTNIGNNCTHGSDAPETAAFELSYFFAGYEMI